MKQRNHIIQQQNIEINFENFPDGIGIQNEISDLFHEKLFPEMEMLFDNVAGEKYLLSIENMEIDCGLLSAKNWKDELIDQALTQMKVKLAAAEKKDIKEVELGQKRQRESFLFFLEHGRLPWNSIADSIKELEEVEIDATFLKEFRELIQATPKTAERFVYSFSEFFFDKIAQSLSADKNENTEDIYFFIQEKIPLQSKKDSKVVLLKMLSDERKNKQEIFNSFAGDQKAAEQPKSIEDGQLKIMDDKKDRVAKTHSESIAKELYIHNAGLVILHPFLETLFSRIGLIQEKKWVDDISQHAATRVLEYLVAGNKELAETESVLNKLMCGIPVGDVLLPSEKLADEAKAECEELLTEVLKHWGKLKNTSVATLREIFLQRNGKLTAVENGWRLNVEQKAFDILLESLPWGIGTVKLPWAGYKLHVEWT